MLPRFHLLPINVLVSYSPSEGPKTLGVLISEGLDKLRDVDRTVETFRKALAQIV